MNQYLFAYRNYQDKLFKILTTPKLIKFYFNVYIKSKLNTVEPDLYIISYPKCGRTWLRVMLTNYISRLNIETGQNHDPSIFEIKNNITIKFEHDQGNWVPRPTKPKKMSFNKNKYTGKKIVFLIRDPRDVIVSSWYHLKFREHIFKKGIHEYIHDELIGIKNIISFYNLWLNEIFPPDNFHILTYEDLHADAYLQMKKFIQFINVGNMNENTLKEAIEYSRFGNMKKMEMSGNIDEPWMKPGSKRNSNSMKIRKGKVGSYQDEISASDIDFINSYMKEYLHPKVARLYL
jgi:hypothetical protein